MGIVAGFYDISINELICWIANFKDIRSINMNYSKFLELSNKIEENEKCPYCQCDQLASADFESLLFLCPNCGEIIEFDEDGNAIDDE